MPLGGAGSAARTCGGRARGVGSRARLQRGAERARAAARSGRTLRRPFDDVFDVSMRLVDLYESSHQQGHLPYARTQCGQSLSHGL